MAKIENEDDLKDLSALKKKSHILKMKYLKRHHNPPASIIFPSKFLKNNCSIFILTTLK